MAQTRDRLWGPALVATGPTTVLTAGATELIEIQIVWVSNPTANVRNFTLSIGTDGASTRLIGTNASGNIPANSAVPFVGPFYVKPSEIVTISADTGAVLNCSGHGIRRGVG